MRAECAHCRERLARESANQNIVGRNLGLDIDGPDVASDGSVREVSLVKRYAARCHLGREHTLAADGFKTHGEALGGHR